VEYCDVNIILESMIGDDICMKSRVSSVAIPNSLTSGMPGLLLSSFETSKSIHIKMTSGYSPKSARLQRPKHCWARCIPPSQGMRNSCFFCFLATIF
jgi:hypothetical protein